MKENMSFREMLGQRLFISVEGTEITDELRMLITEYKCGNIVLFQPNIVSFEQTKRLCREIQELVTRELGESALIAIDQEGGGVTRLSEDFVNVPGAMALAATGDGQAVYDASAVTAHELRAAGVNFNFAPVADISCDPDNPVIGVRSFGETPEAVSRYAVRAYQGFEDGHIASSAKHFPGHGDTHTDSHLSLPSIDKTLEELESFEFRPFEALIRAGCPAVMTAHIVYPQIEKKMIPATMSRLFLTDILRGRMGFDGLILTDSLEMNAIRRVYGAGRGAVAAIQAGCDMLLTGKGAEIIIEEINAVEAAAARGEIDMDEMAASLRRIEACKRRYCLPPEGEAGCAAARTLSDGLRRRSMTLVSGKIPALGKSPLFVGPEDYRLALVSNEVGLEESFPQFMAGHLGGREITTGNSISDTLIAEAAEAARGASCVVASLYNAHVFRDQLRLFDAVRHAAEESGVPVVAVCLRNPTDLEYAEGCAARIEAWDYSRASLEITAELLSGELVPTGCLPVTLRSRA